jgi:hypothetical protein
MRRLDTATGERYLKACVYGASGSGKSCLGVTAPKPLILLSELQGMLHIEQHAARLGVPVPPVIFCEQMSDYSAVVRALYADKSKPFRVLERVGEGNAPQDFHVTFQLEQWPETVVVDSVTDVCRLIIEKIRAQSPAKMGRDGLPVDSDRFWNVLGDRFGNFVQGFRDAPLNVLFLALKDDREVGDEGNKRRQVGPDLAMRKFPEKLSAACNLTGYAYRREYREKGKVVKTAYGVMFSGPEYMTLKGSDRLRDVEAPNFTYWKHAVEGQLDGEAPAAPPTSSESLAADVGEDDRPVQLQSGAPEAETQEQAPVATDDGKAEAAARKAQDGEPGGGKPRPRKKKARAAARAS